MKKGQFAPSKTPQRISKAAHIALWSKSDEKYNAEILERMRGLAWLRATQGGI